MRGRFLVLSVCILAALLTSITSLAPASANHSYGNYHWARTANPFQLQLTDNVDSNWDYSLAYSSALWSYSPVLDTTVVPGTTLPSTCSAPAGRIAVCNAKYGINGWMGIAQLYATGDHITSAAVKLNDSYVGVAPYNTPAWRQFITCQEIGHALGLDHQDINWDNANLNTCMDYGRDPASNQRPNAHDYQQLNTIYAHLDTTSTVGASSSGTSPAQVGNNEKSWGRAVEGSRAEGHSVHVRDLGRGKSVITHVTWTP